MARPRFDVRRHTGTDMVAATSFTYNGVGYSAGDPFPTDGIDPRRLRTQYDSRKINFSDPDAADPKRPSAPSPEDDKGVTLTAQPGGYYLVSAPWLDEPERVRGKAAAGTLAKELREEGPPAEPDSADGYTLTAGENGWYAITRDDDESETPVALNVHGEEAARATVAALRAGEAPEGTALPAEWADEATETPAEGAQGDEAPVDGADAPATPDEAPAAE